MADDLQEKERVLESKHPSLVDRYYQPKYIIGKFEGHTFNLLMKID
jgi:hypothetical protein